jgi:serine/threonine protein kinase
MATQTENFRNRFKLETELGKGATGVVYLAYDNFLQKVVALKLTQLSLFEDDEDGARNRRMWLNETRLAGKLNHPFIVHVIEYGNSDEFDYLVMEYISGGTLKQYSSADNLLPLARLIDILYKVCNGLEYANKMGVLHRDIKPSNVLLGKDNSVKISDFGSAFLLNSELTQVDTVGTLPFMAPEHFRQSRPTIQSDIYAVGVMAYQLLTGTLPFNANSKDAIIYQKLHGEAIPLENRRQDIPQALRFAVHRAMHPDKDHRYTTWQEFCDDLAMAIPQVARPEETRFDSSLFGIIRNLAFFSSFSDVEVWETVGFSSWKKFASDESIIKEGDVSNSFYIISGGAAVVTKSGVVLSNLGKGDCFGEMAFIDEVRNIRLATVTAITDINLIEIDGNSLLQASDRLQSFFAKAFLNLMVARLSATNHRLLMLEVKNKTAA